MADDETSHVQHFVPLPPEDASELPAGLSPQEPRDPEKVILWVGSIAGLAFTIVSVAGPFAFDLDPLYWRVAFTVGMAALIASGAVGVHWRYLRKRSTSLIVALVVVTTCLEIGLINASATAPMPENYSRNIWNLLTSRDQSEVTFPRNPYENLSALTNLQLQQVTRKLADELRQFQSEYDKIYAQKMVQNEWRVAPQSKAEMTKRFMQQGLEQSQRFETFQTEYRRRFFPQVALLRDELLSRTGHSGQPVYTICTTLERGTALTDDGMLSGVEPVGDAAACLDQLAVML